MNLKVFILGIFAAVLFLNSCNDDLKSVGMTTKPNEDGNKTQADTFFIKANTILADSIYSRTIEGLLGEMYDPLYGNLKADYLCQFYVEDGFSFGTNPIYDRIDSVKLAIYYTSWVGDSIAPMTANIYTLDKVIDRHFYTNVNPEEYYSPSDLLASRTYTSRDYSVSDSTWNADNTNGSHLIPIELPLSFGEKFYNDTKNHPEYFATQDAFNEYFKGLYVTTSSNSKGNFLKTLQTAILFFYEREFVTKSKVDTEKDSTYIATTYTYFTPTVEVVQKNRIKHDELTLQRLINDTEYAYIDAPAGLYTQLTIPTASENLIDKIEGRTVNNLFFSIKVKPEQEWDYALAPPPTVLLLPKDSLITHFEKGRLNDTSAQAYMATYTATGRTYNFGNIANIVMAHITNEDNLDKDIELVLVPVDVQTDTYSSVVDMRPSLTPSATQFLKDEDNLKVYITSSKFNDYK